MVSVGPDGACQWKSGSIQKHSDHIISSSGSSATTFRLFDHITVSHTNSMMNINGDLSPLMLEQQSRTDKVRDEQKQAYSTLTD